MNKRGYTNYTPEFKLEAVRRASQPGAHQAAIAREMGVANADIISRWKMEYQNGRKWINREDSIPLPDGMASGSLPVFQTLTPIPSKVSNSINSKDESNPSELQKHSSELAELKKKVADLTDERDHLKALLARYL